MASGEETGDGGVELTEPETVRRDAEDAGGQELGVVGVTEEHHGEHLRGLSKPVEEPPVRRVEVSVEEEQERNVRPRGEAGPLIDLVSGEERVCDVELEALASVVEGDALTEVWVRGCVYGQSGGRPEGLPYVADVAAASASRSAGRLGRPKARRRMRGISPSSHETRICAAKKTEL